MKKKIQFQKRNKRCKHAQCQIGLYFSGVTLYRNAKFDGSFCIWANQATQTVRISRNEQHKNIEWHWAINQRGVKDDCNSLTSFVSDFNKVANVNIKSALVSLDVLLPMYKSSEDDEQ